MIPYIVTFSLTILFTYIAQRMFKCEENEKKQKRNIRLILGIFFSILAILIPVLLAGFRDETIGADVTVYVKKVLERTTFGLSFSEFNKLNSSTDFLYNVLNYLVSFITTDLNSFMFIVELIIVSLVFATIYYYRDKSPMWVGMMIFLLMYYNRSLNLIRQSISLAITFYAFKYLREKSTIRYFLTIIIAMLFHNSAIITGIMYFVYHLIKNKKTSKTKIFFLTILICLLLVNYGSILKIFINVGILPAKYSRYIPTGEIDFVVSESLMKIVFMLPILYYRKSLCKYNDDNEFIIFMIIIDFILMQAGILSGYAQRISFYFGYYYILLIPQLYKVLSKKRYNVINFLYTLGLCVYWYYMFVVLSYGKTYPYTSTILGIF